MARKIVTDSGCGAPGVLRWPLVALLLLTVALPAAAERGLTIDEVWLNGFRTREIAVKPGETIQGTVTVSTSSNSFFHVHTGVWLPSWDKRNEAMRRFLDAQGGGSNQPVEISVPAPSAPGVYYLLFCFDRKREYEMFAELTSRTDEQIFANGRAIKVTVDPNAVAPPPPNSRENAAPLPIDGAPLAGRAGHGSGNEFWAKVNTSSFASSSGQALRVTLVGASPTIDLDLEMLDAENRRIGYSENEGSKKEISDVRVPNGNAVFIRVFAYRQGEAADFRMTAGKVSYEEAKADVSQGRAVAVDSAWTGQGHAGKGLAAAAWYAVTMEKAGRLDAEIDGLRPAAELDLVIYDDFGNLRARSRSEGSRFEQTSVANAEAGAVFYVGVRANETADESDFRITIWTHGRRPPAPASPVTPPVAGPGSPAPAVPGAGQKLPVAFELARGRDFTGFFRVDREAEFAVEVASAFGDAGKFDTIALQAPDGTLLWSMPAQGRKWEIGKTASRGPGLYRLRLQYTGEGVRKGQVDVTGLTDRNFYPETAIADPGGGPGLDAAEKEALQRLYEMMARRGNGKLTPEAQELLDKLEAYFERN